MEKIIHHKLGLNDEIENQQNFYKILGKQIRNQKNTYRIGKKIIYEKLQLDEKIKNK